VIEAVIVLSLCGTKSPGSAPAPPRRTSSAGRVAAVGLARDPLEGLAVILDAHQLAGALVTLLPMAVGPLELGAAGHRSPPKSVASIFRHRFNPLPCALRFVVDPFDHRLHEIWESPVDASRNTTGFLVINRVVGDVSVVDSAGETVRWGVQRRLEFIDFRLFWDGRFNRRDLAETFGISAQQASADIALYTERAPGNLAYDSTLKAYMRTPGYEPKVMHASAERYLLQLVAIENRWMRQEDTWFVNSPPIENIELLHKRTDAQVLLRVLQAINQNCELEIQYKSITGSPEPARVIAPHALFHAHGRWYVRAWSTEHKDFRDYNLFRIDKAADLAPSTADPALDFEWLHKTDLTLSPNPELSPSQQAAIEAEYEMDGGRLVVTMRLSQTFYLMTEHNLDVPPGTLSPGKQQLVLLNPEEVVNARATARKLSIDAIARASRSA
jgi:hypothetical protein